MTDTSLTQELKRVDDAESAHAACAKITKALGFEYFLYAVRIPVSLTKPYHFVVSGYPVAWREVYEARGYLQIDPIIRHVFNALDPVCWDSIPRDESTIAGFFTEAERHGLGNGITVPVCGHGGEIGLWSVARQQPLPTDTNERVAVVQRAQAFATAVHQNIRRVALSMQSDEQRQSLLSEREKDCLQWVADGKTSWEIGQIMQISEATVVYHIQRATSKLGVRGRQMAVTKAAALGEIEPKAFTAEKPLREVYESAS